MRRRTLTIAATFAVSLGATMLAPRADAVTLGAPSGLRAATVITALTRRTYYGYGCGWDCEPGCWGEAGYGYDGYYGGYGGYYGGYPSRPRYGYGAYPYAWPRDLNWGYRTRWYW